ncbi:MAG: hydantoin racemase [Proteobacteria bacterium]|nr:hydantoin racemase [Burkholderiales bacterium]
MRLLVANANMTQAITDVCVAAAREVAMPGTEVFGATGTFGAQVIGSRSENALAQQAMLELAATHAPHCAAMVIAVSMDTGLGALRELLPIPVIGMTEAAALTACTVGANFAVVTFGTRHRSTYRELIDGYGLGARCVCVEAIDAGPNAALADPQAAVRALAGLSERAIAEHGAESIVMAGAVAAGWQRDLQALLPVPVLEGIRCATVMAESLVRLGLPKPTLGSYSAPGARVVHGVGPALARMFDPSTTG